MGLDVSIKHGDQTLSYWRKDWLIAEALCNEIGEKLKHVNGNPTQVSVSDLERVESWLIQSLAEVHVAIAYAERTKVKHLTLDISY